MLKDVTPEEEAASMRNAKHDTVLGRIIMFTSETNDSLVEPHQNRGSSLFK